MNNEKKGDKDINVRVITTSGSYPDHGHERVPEDEQLVAILERAAQKLQIADHSGWIATIDGRQLDKAKSYAENGLHGEAKIDFGMPEGGGGASKICCSQV